MKKEKITLETEVVEEPAVEEPMAENQVTVVMEITVVLEDIQVQTLYRQVDQQMTDQVQHQVAQVKVIILQV